MQIEKKEVINLKDNVFKFNGEEFNKDIQNNFSVRKFF